MRPIVVKVGPLAAASPNNIVTVQATPAVGAILPLTAGAAAGTIPDTARRVLITSTGNDSGTTITVSGTDWNNSLISENVTGINTTAYTVYDYKTVTSIVILSAAGANTVGNITVGTNGVASSRPVFLDTFAMPQTSIQVSVSGTINYTVRQTLDNPNSPNNPVLYSAVTWLNHPDSNLVAAAGNVQGNYAYVPSMVQLLINSNTNPAYATMTLIQADA
jgi:hypothetical protein